jgi:phage replication-related protein YjqB (UPF0714/DUF867 family)
LKRAFFVWAAVAAWTAVAAWPSSADDFYPDAVSMEAAWSEGRDYRVEALARGSPVAVFAIHGGIEPGTARVARALAGADWNLFVFQALGKDIPSEALHVTSRHFNDPRALQLARSSLLGISIHGEKDSGSIACIGGLNAPLRQAVAQSLRAIGIDAQEPCSRFPALALDNIANVPRDHGIQIEMTKSLRNGLVRDQDRLARFAEAVREAVSRVAGPPR